MSRKITYGLIPLLVFCEVAAFAQVQDAGLWLSAAIEKRVSRSVSFCFTEEVRLDENMSEVGTIFSDIGVEYRFLKRFSVAGYYRFTLKRRLDDTYEPRNRHYIDIGYREKFNPVKLTLRLRFQSQYPYFFADHAVRDPEYDTRVRLKLALDLNRRYEPYLSAESFFGMSNNEGVCLDAMRYCADVEYNFNRMHKIDLHYMIQQEYQVKNPETDFILGLSYSFLF